ncbi:MAG TPA: hypothetical protein PLV88_01265 [Methanoregulaceae archaeon]|nr:hypothetical protein [Methanoregulaceae archaeon]HNI42353.1 hypothetical protein [Methanoregulaceae archaeon]HOU81212.1 hypothetical protein [Methanoregulaceae archaeon]
MGVVLFSTAAPPSGEPGRQVGTNKGLDGSGNLRMSPVIARNFKRPALFTGRLLS